MINKQLLSGRFAKAAATYSREACVQQQIALKMVNLLKRHLPDSPLKSVVEFGCGTGGYSRLLLGSLPLERLLLNDISSEMKLCCQDLLLNKGVSFLAGDAEALPFPRQTELITSCSALQWFDAPEAFFERCNSSLSAEGYLAFSTFGEENLREIRQLTGSGLPYRSLEALKGALEPMYDILYAEEELIPLAFEAPMQVLYHLKQTGVNGVAPYRWTRSGLERFCQQYACQFGRGSSVSLTYHPIYIITKKKKQ